MEDNLISILSSFGYPVYRQGSMSDDEAYPPTFFTFWNYDSPDHSHYDNSDYGTVWSYNIYVYSDDPELTYSVLANARAALKEAEPDLFEDLCKDYPVEAGNVFISIKGE